MTRVKTLVYHGKAGGKLRDYYSIVYDDQMVYILTVDGKEVERHPEARSRNYIETTAHVLL